MDLCSDHILEMVDNGFGAIQQMICTLHIYSKCILSLVIASNFILMLTLDIPEIVYKYFDDYWDEVEITNMDWLVCSTDLKRYACYEYAWDVLEKPVKKWNCSTKFTNGRRLLF